VEPDTSFVIAARDGTDKILQARKIPGCSVVKASWLMECFWTLTQRDPTQHLLNPAGQDNGKEIPNGNVTGILSINQDAESDESDDDDFAAAMEADLLQ